MRCEAVAVVTGGEHERAGRPLRRDALANQERLLAAATAVFLHEGYHVPMATIAAEAGVGVGTLYRRYPSRVALLEALTHRSFRLLVALAEEAEARAGEALARLDWYWDRVIDQRDQLVLPLHGGPPVAADHVRAERARLHACLRRLLEPAVATAASATTSAPTTSSSSGRCSYPRCPARRTGTP